MSGNLGGFRSSGRSTAAVQPSNPVPEAAGFAALLTFPGEGIYKVFSPSHALVAKMFVDSRPR